VRNRQQILQWEARWSLPVGVLTLLAVAALVISLFVATGASGDGSAALLRADHAHRSAQTISGILQAIGFALFIAPLFFLFRAVQGRDSRVRSQLVGLVVIAPLFLAASIGFSVAARGEAGDQFVAGQAKSTLSPKEAHKECLSDRQDKGADSFGEEFEAGKGQTALAACEDRKTEDDEASNAVSEASLARPATGLGLAGGLGLVVAFFYTCLWAMRTGLLGRFWAVLGMALGVALLVNLILVVIAWLVYFGLLAAGWLPRGRPPAWAAGEAVPWPTPGEKAAASLEPDPDPEPPALDNGDSSSSPGEERRKRKQRD
jgi:hypothetical protein